MVHTHLHYPAEEEEISHKCVDVRSKILSTFFIILIGSLLVDIKQLFWFFLIVLWFVVALRPKKTFIKHSLVTIPLIASFTLIVFLTFKKNTEVFSNFFFFTVHNNVSLAVFFGLRSYLLVLIILILINSEKSFFEIVYGMDDLKFPHLLTDLLFLTYRFIFILQDELVRILEARSNRLYGEKLRMNVKSLRMIGNILGSVLARSFKRAEHISATLAAKGYSGNISHPEQPWTLAGVLFLCCNIVFSFLLVFYGQVNLTQVLEVII
ncbi:MAG: energy-coupling factor transporter transmembrane component T family protein [Candidatus Hodarchaeales archaeon]